MSNVAWRKKLGENGPGVADPPDATLVAEPPLSLLPTIDSQADSSLGSVTADLAAAESGVEFVYRSLDRMQRSSEAEDVLVIVDDGPLGRQAFRAGRRPIETSWAQELVRSGAAGIHATPAPIDIAVAGSVMQLCSLALQLDVARHDSRHDALTGLLNRRAFDEALARSCAQSQRYGWPFALVVLDLGDVKMADDRFGHDAGDATLQAVGSELRLRLRGGDVAARIGGDEFALVLPNVGEAAVAELVDRIERTIESAVPNAGVTLSAGYAVSPDDGFRPEDLFSTADARLSQGKRP